MKWYNGKTVLAAGMLLGLNSMTVQAALFDRGGGLIYDDVLDVTWLQDANYAKTSGYSVHGMDWETANAWADGLVFRSYEDWRLPRITDILAQGCDNGFSGTDCGYNVNTNSSELAYMFHVNLKNSGKIDPNGNLIPGFNGIINSSFQNAAHDNAVIDFNNIYPGFYWSHNDYYPNSFFAMAYEMQIGYQGPIEKFIQTAAWALRDGDVTTVPIPSSIWLFASGLLGLVTSKKIVTRSK